jgi:hypothetical protein
MERTDWKTDLAQLDRSIARSQWIGLAVISLALLLYAGWFWMLKSKPLSEDSGSWGEFGDYVGGLLNPLVAYFAFYWLTRSVRLQKEELFETRVALQESSQSQKKQAEYAGISLRINALTALVNSIIVEVQTQRTQLQFIVDQMARTNAFAARLLDGTYKQGPALQVHLDQVAQQISARMTERADYESELKQLLVRSAA